jgi:hypothetical protein
MLFQQIIPFAFLVLLVASQNTIIEYAPQDATCTETPYRIYNSSTKCTRGPVRDRYGLTTCNKTLSSQGTVLTCLDCALGTSCTVTHAVLDSCLPTSPPSGRVGPWKFLCAPGMLPESITNPQPSLGTMDYTEYQEGFCQIPLTTYRQTRLGCIGKEFFGCNVNGGGVQYIRYDGDNCKGNKLEEKFMRFNICYDYNGNNVKIAKCTPWAYPNEAGRHILNAIVLLFLVGTWMLTIIK